MKILVVDDSRSDLKVIRSNLEWHGCQVIEATNGREGLELAAAQIPDLIVSDCLMPVMDGFQFIFELKKLSQLESIPFIFYSDNYAGEKEAELALSLGARAFLEKQKGPDKLWDEIGRIITAGETEEPAVNVGGWPAEEYLKNYAQPVVGMLEEKLRDLSTENETLVQLNGELERRLAEQGAQLQAANEELEMFSYSVSHDLRAPLRHIDGFSQALLEEYAAKLNSVGGGYLDRIRKSNGRMMGMIDAILEFSRCTRGDMVRQAVELSALTGEVAGALARSHPERHVDFRIAQGISVSGDARLLRVVMENLLSNAWKMTALREDALIEFFETTWDARRAFAVRDNGVGFDTAFADKLFTPFQMVHSPEEFPGRGVGLAIARRIISRHGGKIRADSEPGKGATFTFTL